MNPNNICENGVCKKGYFITLDQLVELCDHVILEKAYGNEYVETVKIIENKIKEMP